MKYKLIVSGGTFDHFHKGHKEFLKKQLAFSEKIILGITSNTFAKEKKQDKEIQEYSKRRSAVENFLKQEQAKKRVEIVPIDTIYIPKDCEKRPIEAIIVTKETESGAVSINNKRQNNGLPPLKIVILKHILAEDGFLISSHRIRNGEINREGKVYINPEFLKTVFVLPEDIRYKLKKPFGKLIKAQDLEQYNIDREQTITVGDITTMTFNQLSLKQRISVIDFTVERSKRFNDITELGFLGNEHIISVSNPAGTIQPEVFNAVKKTLVSKDRSIILVKGEEDLIVLACILASPLEFRIFYGQPGEGMVEVLVSEEVKEETHLIVSKFSKTEASNTRGY